MSATGNDPGMRDAPNVRNNPREGGISCPLFTNTSVTVSQNALGDHRPHFCGGQRIDVRYASSPIPYSQYKVSILRRFLHGNCDGSRISLTNARASRDGLA